MRPHAEGFQPQPARFGPSAPPDQWDIFDAQVFESHLRNRRVPQVVDTFVNIYRENPAA